MHTAINPSLSISIPALLPNDGASSAHVEWTCLDVAQAPLSHRNKSAQVPVPIRLGGSLLGQLHKYRFLFASEEACWAFRNEFGKWQVGAVLGGFTWRQVCSGWGGDEEKPVHPYYNTCHIRSFSIFPTYNTCVSDRCCTLERWKMIPVPQFGKMCCDLCVLGGGFVRG